MYTELYQTQTTTGHFYVQTKEPDHYYCVKQFHSDVIVELDEVKNSPTLLDADGIIWDNNSLAPSDKIVVYTADCLPILLEGHTRSAIVHAGWRGVHNKIYLDQKIKEMNPQTAFIGPSIYVDSYQVGQEFLDYFPNSKNFVTRPDGLYFDMQNEVKLNLLKTFPQIKITESYICTFENIQYNSFRRTKSTKRNYNIFSLRGK